MDASPALGVPRADIPLVAEMVALSRRFGADPEFVRAGGGNSSAKLDGVMFIKPSGVSLAALTAESLIPLAIAPLREVLERRATSEPASGSGEVLRVAEAARLPPKDDHRPSVELLFHALLPEPIVLHTHPTTINTLTCAAAGRELAERILGDRVLWIPYTDPGLPLARAIRDARLAHRERTGDEAPRVALLQNHGLIVSGSTAAEIEERSTEIVAAISSYADELPTVSWDTVAAIEDALAQQVADALRPRIGALLSIAGRPGVVVLDDTPLALNVAGSELGHRFASGGPLTPDQIVYAGSWPLLLPARPLDGPSAADAFEAALAGRTTRGIESPIIVLVAGVGLFAVGETEGQADIARTLFMDAMRIAVGAHRLGGIRPLSEAERRFIDDWEAEAYRKSVARATW